MSKFTHLHLHTEYSLLDGFTRIDRMFERLKELDMDSVAITDHGSMFGVVDFYKKAKKNGIKPIIGCEVYTAERTLFDKDPVMDKNSGHLVLLCKDNQGYQNLIKLVSQAYIDGFYYKPRIDYNILKENSKGLIALSACLAGDVQRYIIQDNYEKAKDTALELASYFDEGDFFLELQDHKMDIQKKVNDGLLKLSEDTGLPLVATNDVHYIDKSDDEVHDVLLCIQTGKNVGDQERMRFPSNNFYLKSYEEMRLLFPYAEEALENTVKIADRCNVDFDFETRHLPEYKLDNGTDHIKYLRNLCIDGINERYDEATDELIERVDFELDIIKEMGYEDYFLIVWDFIKYAKDNGIMVGAGRGSCGGSLIAYALRITDVDPMKYGLIFERFLNPERVTMPDIDIDFEDDRRGEVIDYVINKYGYDKVAQIITFGTMGARAAIRDVGRVLEMPYADVDRIAKMIPFSIGITLDKALQMNKELNDLYVRNTDVKKLIDISKSLEGVPRHASTHAAGVVISKKPVDEYVPLYVHDGNVSTQFNMNLLEELGLLKMDFLGLRTLSVLKNAMRLIKENRGIEIDLDNLDLTDKETYKLLSSGETLGIFQLESAGMRQFMRELKPSNIEDIIAGISLYRPGPMDSIPKYIKNKNNISSITYIHDSLIPILDVTYGCLVYQEQVMQIVRELGGYSYGRSDLVRRAMGKKKMDVMEKEREYFIHGKTLPDGTIEIEGCKRKGVPEDAANIIFDDMIDFAKYAFNKSHAAGYGIIAYQTAYLKAHYPVEFMAAQMSSMIGSHGKVAQYIEDCKNMDIEVLKPDVNYSDRYFSVEKGKIRYGLLGIKNVGTGIISCIIENRKDAPYTDFYEFLISIPHKELNKRAVESLIKAGAFDSLGIYRSRLLSSFERIIDGIQNDRRRNVEGQFSMFGVNSVVENNDKYEYPEIAEFNKKYLLNFEKEMIGIYISGHPLDEFKELIDNMAITKIADLHTMSEDLEQIQKYDNSKHVVVGFINKRRDKATRNNSFMSFLEIEDLTGNIEVIVFPKTLERYAHLISEESSVIITGRLNIKEDEPAKLIAESLLELNKDNSSKYKLQRGHEHQTYRQNTSVVKGINNKSDQKLYIRIETLNERLIEYLKDQLKGMKGNVPVVVYEESTKKSYKISKDFFVTIDEKNINYLQSIFGVKNVKIK